MLGFRNSHEVFCLVSALTIAIFGFDLMIGFLLDYNKKKHCHIHTQLDEKESYIYPHILLIFQALVVFEGKIS